MIAFREDYRRLSPNLLQPFHPWVVSQHSRAASCGGDPNETKDHEPLRGAAIIMKAPPGPVRMPGKAKPKAKGTVRASKPRKSATKSKSPPSEGAVLAGMRSREQATGKPASRLIDQRIRDLGGWRGETLARMRALILEADPGMSEEVKWRGTPVWSHHGIVCTGEADTKVVRLPFAWGASV